ncbi:MAG: sugar phosphate isomerase/epimerase family protein, partial [Halorhodospira sp.]
MKLGVMAAMLAGMELDDALDYCKKVGLDAIEIPVGGYPGDPWNLAGAHTDKARVDDLKKKVADRGLEVHGIACHGNPVHPDEAIATLPRLLPTMAER